MPGRNPRRLDLNLLAVFAAVMEERSVTRAAQKLDMTQPAVSNALQRLRLRFEDELFTKSRDGVRPTEAARQLWREIGAPLETILGVTAPTDFDPAATRLTFNVAVTDTLVQVLVPAIIAEAFAEAPDARLHFHQHSDPGSRQGLERGTIDCAVGMFPSPTDDLRFEPLFADDYVCVMRKGHPDLDAGTSLPGFLAARHVLVRQTGSWTGIVDRWMSILGLERENVVVVNSAQEALTVVLQSDLVSAVPAGFIAADPRADRLRTAPLPFSAERIIYKLAHHPRSQHDAARVWLRGVVRRAVARLDTGG